MRYEIRLAGEGGQGLILAGLILAEAAVHDGHNAAHTQSYGPEARGGASKSEVIISDEEIDYPKLTEADLLLAMSQEACDKYLSDLKKDGILIVDSAYVTRVPLTIRACCLPITKIAEKTTGKQITASIVALGLIVGLTGWVSQKAIEVAVAARAPQGTQELNLLALHTGLKTAESLKSKESNTNTGKVER